MHSNARPRYLDQLVADHRLTADGRDWLVLALDPFHDLNHQAAGYPDTDGSQTIVSCYQYQTDVSAPEATVGNWDAHIYTLPLSSSSAFVVTDEGATWTALTDTAGATNRNQGPLNIITAPSGGTLVPSYPFTANTQCTTLPFVGNTDLVTGVTRIIGLGYEVTNTTAEINKQGAVTSYRMPQFSSKPGNVLYRSAAAGTYADTTVTRWRTPPSNAAEANLLKGSRTWDASAGVYATAVLNTVHNPLETAATGLVLFQGTSYPGVADQGFRSPLTVNYANTAPAMSSVTPSAQQTIPYDTTGSIFTGLSQGTTLTIKLKVYVERAPTLIEPNLTVLATPSAGYDTHALQLYSQAISQLPVAVTVGENGAGDWFRAVVRVLKEAVHIGAEVVGPSIPGAAQVGTAARTILGRLDNLIAKRTSSSVSNTVAPRPRLLSGIIRQAATVAAQSVSQGQTRFRARKPRNARARPPPVARAPRRR